MQKRKMSSEEKHYKEFTANMETIDQKINVSHFMQVLQDQREEEERNKRITEAKDNIILSLRQNNPFTFSQYLIVWDIIHYNFDQIINDLERKRINRQEVNNAINYVEKFSDELIGEYWKEKLLQ